MAINYSWQMCQLYFTSDNIFLVMMLYLLFDIHISFTVYFILAKIFSRWKNEKAETIFNAWPFAICSYWMSGS